MSRNTRSAATQYDTVNQDGLVFRPHSERIVSATRELNRLAARIAELKQLLRMGVAVVEDFMPNIGRCVLQDYGRLNDFLLATRKITEVKDEQGDE